MARKSSAPADKPNASPNDVAECYAEYSEHRASIGRITQKIATMLGRFEKMGVDPKAIRYAYTMANKSDAGLEHRSKTRYLAMLSIIETEEDGQTSIMPALLIEKPGGKSLEQLAAARAHADGYNSGRHGGVVGSCPFPAGSEQFVRWRDGWDDGHRDRLARNPDADKVKVATGRKRGRPAKAAPTPEAPEVVDAAGETQQEAA